MKPFRCLSALALLLVSVAPARAGADWHLRTAAGMSVSGARGSAVEVALRSPVASNLALGFEASANYLRVGPSGPAGIVALSGPGRVVGGLTDGITRHRAFMLAPTIQVGGVLHVIASYGLADVLDEHGPNEQIQGFSIGLGLGSIGRGQPSAEFRARSVSDHPFSPRQSLAGTAYTFTFGVDL